MHPFAALQRVLPQHGLSRLLGRFAASRNPLLKNPLIAGFRRLYRVDLSECAGQNPADYASFNAFFARALRPGARPLPTAPTAVVSPADGTVSQAGRIEGGALLQAKGRSYAASQLLADDALARALDGGVFATIYLAPRNYHRVHAPCRARLLRSAAVPGRLFSVNAVTERHVPGLFARNERLVLTLEAEFGAFALVLVGAMIVASIDVAWPGGPRSPYRQREDRAWEDVRFERGGEVAAFLLGSTVVALFPPAAVRLAPEIAPGRSVRMGEPIGRVCAAGAGATSAL